MRYSEEFKQVIIKKSHIRSELYGIEKERIHPRIILKGIEMSKALQDNKEIIEVASPIIQNLYDMVHNSGFLIILTDREGCILKIMGDTNVLKAAEELDMITGAYMNEKSIGTNAMGTAIKEDMPIQISAKEHFIEAYHKWTCSAAPIHFENEIIGSLNLTGYSTEVHPHTLGMVVAAVQSIERNLSHEKLQKELVEAYLYMDSIVSSISHGIVAVDTKGIIRHYNNTAQDMLHLEEKKQDNLNINKFIKVWPEIYQKISQGKSFMYEEVSFNKNNKYNISANPIFNNNKELIGVVLIINEIHTVMKLVNKYSNMVSKYTFHDLIYKSGTMKKIVEFSKRVADSPSTILIQGESGTGKEVLAQAIHNQSSRANNPFIVINCGAIPKNLIESELFGYDDGAFTGAKRGGKSGKFELAHGGTLFLDEIGEMPLDMQVNLLRVLQEGYINRVGGDKYIPIDVKIIAATNKNLKEEVNKGTFREDLYYRLSVIPIMLPPLRERKEDLQPLIEHFLRTKARKLNKMIPHISQEHLNQIYRYEWKGNVRELENYIENVVNLDGKTTINIKNLDIFDKNISNKEVDRGNVYLCTLEELEKKAIISCLKEYDNNISKVAKTLDISRNTLYLKMKKYNINKCNMS
ncbi:sigma-54-dependent Fis family transcriptional regulator [Oceanirhabdus sp. W0125-5]|uniref:sigma-54-dependent Fis family transcriptional regulator n=1 Tax=Oceanirhabdus sp. W0125-5 TaxID=2999116 RepID=UPI0022F3237D|nr:sigma 54-interacting transcriptional regulator [Oceanirhabdus sp. W0125-5]WBW98561.1 sigma 54-interacting transcriptional regulator [Oceanirhabdus sp. W0125-5]